MFRPILIALTATTLVIAQQPLPARPVDLLLNKARTLESRGRLDLAAQAWQQLLMIDPNQQDAIAGLARAAKARGNDAESARWIERLRKSNPNNPAIQQIEALAKNEKRNPQLEEAGRLAQAGQAEKAVALYRTAFGSNTPPAAWAIAYYETLAGTPGGWEQATAGLEEAMSKNPGGLDLKLALGKLYTYRPNTRAKGIALLESLTGTYARSAQQPWRQALVWENGSARTSDSLRRYLALYPDPTLQITPKKAEAAAGTNLVGGEDLRQAYKALRSEDLPGAEKLFRDALEKNPKEAGALAGLGFVRMKQEDFRSALTQFESAAAIAPGNRVVQDAIKEARFWGSIQTGSAAMKAGRSEEALNQYKAAFTARPADLNAIEGYSGALMSSGKYAEAIPLLERLLRADANNIRTWIDLVHARSRAVSPQAALDTIRTIPPATAAKLNVSVEYMSMLATIQKSAGQLQAAGKTLADLTVLAEQTQDIPAYVRGNLASLYLDFGEPARAMSAYSQALDGDPTSLDVWEGFLLSSNRTGESRAALKKLQSLPETVHEAAQRRPSFLRAVAALQTSVGNIGSAETLSTLR